jgi:hypothetical protein
MATYMLNASVDFTVMAPGSFYAKGWSMSPVKEKARGLAWLVCACEPQWACRRSQTRSVTTPGDSGHHLILDKDYEQVEFRHDRVRVSLRKEREDQRVFESMPGKS